MLVVVALPVPLYKEFDYLLATDVQCSESNNTVSSPSLPAIGCRVRVPFGARKLVGIVTAHRALADTTIEQDKLKAIIEVIDVDPLLQPQLLTLANWLAAYYHYPIGEVFAVMLPAFIRQGKTAAYLTELTQKITHSCNTNNANNTDSLLTSSPLSLNEQQQQAVAQINDTAKDSYQGFLLNGITGSGKTEVYLQAMQPILTQGKQVLILVPEIGLTPQTKARFAKRFNLDVLLLHSAISNKKRLEGWLACKHKLVNIIIGTRSTLLYTFANLGMIIVDEAHDASYKQQDHLRYHAADIALYRGLQHKIPVVLGTATPTLEQLALVQQNKLTELLLTTRAGSAVPPRFKLVDARLSKMAYIQQENGDEQSIGLTKEVVKAIEQTLSAGNQVLIFLNRRGYAPVLLCESCGWQADCRHCDAHLTVHKSVHVQNLLKCHHCGWQLYQPEQCPDCSSNNLAAFGMATSKLSEQLHALFANPQTSRQCYPIIQIDRDTTKTKDSWQKIYQQIHGQEETNRQDKSSCSTGNNQRKNPAILVGTQMIAKGHHFPDVTLVVMPNADRGFLSANFRSPEQTAQLIMQVAGRAGRGKTKGTVMIQTLKPDNPLLIKLIKDGYQEFAQDLLVERSKFGLPPYVRACLIECSGKSAKRTHQALADAVQILPQSQHIAVSGVLEAPMPKQNGRYHAQLLLLAKDRTEMHRILDAWWHRVSALPSAKYLRFTIDIDPISW